MKNKLYLSIFIASVFLFSCKTQVQEYEKKVVFEPGITLDQKVKQAAHLVPTAQQLEWQKLEMTALLKPSLSNILSGFKNHKMPCTYLNFKFE